MTRRLISSGSPFEARIGYSRAVTQGPWCWVSGTTGYDYATMTMPEDPAEQTRNCLDTIEKALVEAGFALSDVVRTRYYLTSVAIYDAVIPVLGERFGAIRPASTMVVCDLTMPEMKIEIEADAYRP
ncbi:MAG: RidA family protein [Pseudomonadota bacterium]